MLVYLTYAPGKEEVTMTLKEVREKRGIKQIAVAKHIGVARQTYCFYEKHPEKMTIDQAKAVCNFLGCDANQIFFNKEVN